MFFLLWKYPIPDATEAQAVVDQVAGLQAVEKSKPAVADQAAGLRAASRSTQPAGDPAGDRQAGAAALDPAAVGLQAVGREGPAAEDPTDLAAADGLQAVCREGPAAVAPAVQFAAAGLQAAGREGPAAVGGLVAPADQHHVDCQPEIKLYNIIYTFTYIR